MILRLILGGVWSIKQHLTSDGGSLLSKSKHCPPPLILPSRALTTVILLDYKILTN